MRTNQSSGWRWHAIQQDVLAQNRRDNDGRCRAAFEGCLQIAVQVHHVIERIDGGTDDDENLMAVCEGCHSRLTTAQVQRRAAARRQAKKDKMRKNHPGRIDRHDS